MYVLSPPIFRHIQANLQFDFSVVCSYSGGGRVCGSDQSEGAHPSPNPLDPRLQRIFFFISS